MARNAVFDLLANIKEEEAALLAAPMGDLERNPDRMTYGPRDNSISGNFTVGKGSWNIHYAAEISPDIIHSFMCRMAVMYRRTKSPLQTRITPRRVRDSLLREDFVVFKPPTTLT